MTVRNEARGRFNGVEFDRHVSYEEAQAAADHQVGDGTPQTASIVVPEPGDWAAGSSALARRPTETVAGLGGGLAVYGFCTQVGLPQLPSTIIAVAFGLVPFAVSYVVDVVRRVKEL